MSSSKKGEFVESRGLPYLDGLSQNELGILALLDRKKEFPAIVKDSEQSNSVVKRLLQSLQEKGFVGREKVAGSDFYFLAKQFELPLTPLHPLLSSLNKLPVRNIEAMSLMREKVERDKLPKSLQKLWSNIVVKTVDLVYLPVYETFFRKKDGSVRKLFIEAVTDKQIKLGNKPN